jgi:hypothetical protein
MPADLGKKTVEPTKPRACYYPKDLNAATRDRPVTMEGHHEIRANCIGYPDGMGCLLDETSGYRHNFVSEASTGVLGYLLFGYVFEYLTVPL